MPRHLAHVQSLGALPAHREKLVVAAACLFLFIVVGACGCYWVLASRRIIYMDHNGTTPMHPRALAEFVRVSRHVFGNPSTACLVGHAARDVLESARADISDDLGCKQTELVFTSGATESNVIVLRGFALAAIRARRACFIITTPIEHASVANTVQGLADTDGVHVLKVGVDRYGVIDAANLAKLVQGVPASAVAMVAFIYINNEIGTVQDVAGLVRMCRRLRGDVHLHVDATQVVGRYVVDAEKLGVDTMSFSAHKFRGPHGVGGLYIRSGGGCALHPVMTGGKQEKGLRGGTENVAGAAAMAVALREAQRHLRCQASVRRVFDMRNWLLAGLRSRVPGLIVNTHPECCAYNTLSVCLPCDSRELIEHLSSRHRICLAVGSACSKSGLSSTLAALGVPESALRGSLRISLGFQNTWRECHRVLRAITAFLDERGHRAH